MPTCSIPEHDEPTVENRVRAVCAAVFHEPPESFTDAFSPDTCPAWDSLGHINLITALEEEFHLTLTLEQAMDMMNFGLVVLVMKDVVREPQAKRKE